MSPFRHRAMHRRKQRAKLRRVSWKPNLEVMESRTLLSVVQAAAQTFYLNDSTANFVPISGGPAVFLGTNYNFASGVNYSDANWTSGSFPLGDFGSIRFQSVAVDAQHRDYFVSVVPVVAGVRLSGLTATVYGRDGFDDQVMDPVRINLPDPNGAIIPTKIIAPTPPNDGSSSLDPEVLRHFADNDLKRAALDLEARTRELDQDYRLPTSLLEDLAELASSTLSIGVPRGFASVVSGAVAVGLFIDGRIEAWLQKKLNQQLIENVRQAKQRLESTIDIARDLAAKTFLPSRVVVTGTSDDFGFGVIQIDGSFQSYRNVFQILGGGHTVGTSTGRR